MVGLEVSFVLLLRDHIELPVFTSTKKEVSVHGRSRKCASNRKEKPYKAHLDCLQGLKPVVILSSSLIFCKQILLQLCSYRGFVRVV
jgi:hypothetical protein